MASRKKYNRTHYSNKLLLMERETIIKALEKTKGSVIKAHKILCPQEKPYSLNALQVRMISHDIQGKQFKQTKE